jgi:hypothetical protein
MTTREVGRVLMKVGAVQLLVIPPPKPKPQSGVELQPQFP